MTGKSLRIGWFLALLCMAIFASSSLSFADTVSGKVETRREAGMNFYFLNTGKGKLVFLGAPFEVNEDPAKACVGQAEESGAKITLTGGKLTSDGTYLGFDNDNYRCVKK